MKRILETGTTCWVHERVEEAGVLVDGKAYYSMFYEAARRAERYLLLSGWQFDSKVALLRGREAAEAEGETTLLPFLNELCQNKPDLRIYVLAWDFSVFFALEREWLQKIAFDWVTHPHLKFAFDKCVPLEGSHHQKFVVVDGALAFVGGNDICEHRWDDRNHQLDNPARFTAEGELYPPYHEVHGFFRGPAVSRLVEFFAERWKCAYDEPLVLAPRETPLETPPHEGLVLPAEQVALCRTISGRDRRCRDIREMYQHAIDAAERFIYIESQYLTARAIVDALVRRFRDATRPKLDVAFILPIEPEAPKEELAMGIRQARAIKRIQLAATEFGHQVGFYCSVACDDQGREIATYIHSKLIVVDDRFLSFGSANLSNRSMGVDTELNVAFEEESARTPLGRAIRKLRVSLLAEHVGAPPGLVRQLVRGEGLVERLDRIASEKKLRLRTYEVADPSEDAPLMSALHESVGRYLDPDRPRLEEDLETPERWLDFFTRGLRVLRKAP